MEQHKIFMLRCIDLARIAGAAVETNPNVGALLVHNQRVIGEGYHKKFGGLHAEAEAINSVPEKDKPLISDSTLYVTLEPCNHEGKTPPCSQLILHHNIKKLVVGCLDPNPLMSGKSLAYLKDHGVTIIQDVLKAECEQLIQPFRINLTAHRPFVTIKFAQSKDFFISKAGEQTWLSNDASKVLSHKLRAQSNAIIIGTNTAVIDNPALTNRLYHGSSPLRIVLDRTHKLSLDAQLLSDEHPTLIITEKRRKDLNNKIKEQWVLRFDDTMLERLMQWLTLEKNIGRLIVEGGAETIKKFAEKGLWDEAIIIQTEKLLEDGVKAPNIEGKLISKNQLGDNTIYTIANPNPYIAPIDQGIEMP